MVNSGSLIGVDGGLHDLCKKGYPGYNEFLIPRAKA